MDTSPSVDDEGTATSSLGSAVPTPTPWRIGGSHAGSDYFYPIVCGGERWLTQVCLVMGLGPFAEEQANAELIVRAVNAYEPMLEALVELRRRYHQIMWQRADQDFADSACAPFDQAIAHATATQAPKGAVPTSKEGQS